MFALPTSADCTCHPALARQLAHRPRHTGCAARFPRLLTPLQVAIGFDNRTPRAARRRWPDKGDEARRKLTDRLSTFADYSWRWDNALPPPTCRWTSSRGRREGIGAWPSKHIQSRCKMHTFSWLSDMNVWRQSGRPTTKSAARREPVWPKTACQSRLPVRRDDGP